jgi:hypothetical protein
LPAGVLACVLALAIVGCSTNVVVSRRDGALYEGAVQGADCESVTVRTKSDGEVHRLSRTDIAFIAHPGVVHIGAGAVLLGISALLAVAGHDAQGIERANAIEASVFYGLIGVPLLAYGGTVNLLSKSETSAGVGGPGCPDGAP